MKKIFTLILTFSLFQLYGQECENFDSSLFNSLPREFPDMVNCIDENGHKQGWWLIFTLKDNPINKTDEIEKGEFVEWYSYGQYKDSRKVGTWKIVENIHQIYERRIDSFYYSKDSTVLISAYANGGWNETKTHYNADSSVIKYSHLLPDEKYFINIYCDKKLPTDQQCQVIYRKNQLKTFPFDRFEFEKERLSIDYFQERKLIDNR